MDFLSVLLLIIANYKDFDFLYIYYSMYRKSELILKNFKKSFMGSLKLSSLISNNWNDWAKRVT